MEGRDLSSRQTQENVAKDMEIGQPYQLHLMFKKLPMASHAKRRRWGLVREPDAGNLHVRFDERGVETELRLSH